MRERTATKAVITVIMALSMMLTAGRKIAFACPGGGPVELLHQLYTVTEVTELTEEMLSVIGHEAPEGWYYRLTDDNGTVTEKFVRKEETISEEIIGDGWLVYEKIGVDRHGRECRYDFYIVRTENGFSYREVTMDYVM